MYKLDQVSADSGKSHCLTKSTFERVVFFCLFLKHLSAFKKAIAHAQKNSLQKEGRLSLPN